METYGFEFKMKDNVSSPFAKMMGNINHGFDVAERRMNGFEKRLNDIGFVAGRLGTITRGLETRRTMSLDTRQLRNAENQVDRLRRRYDILSRSQRLGSQNASQLSGFNTPVNGSSGGAGGLLGLASNPYVMAGLAGVMAVKKVAEFGGDLSNKGYEYERNRFGITQYTGNQATSEKYIDKISKTSTGKMFGADAVAGFQQAVMGFGDAEKSFQFITKRLSNISAGSGMSIAELAGMQAKTRMQGYVQMEEANQWSDRKIPLIQYLQKATNLNSSALLKAIEQRQVKVSSFDKALELMTTKSGIYSGMTDKAMGSGFGQKLAFDNGKEMMMQRAGNGINELFMNRFYKAGNTFLDVLDKQTPKFSGAFTQLSLKLEMANTPLKGFGSQLDFATRSASGFANVLSGVAKFGGFLADMQSKKTEIQTRIGLSGEQFAGRMKLYGNQFADNFRGVGFLGKGEKVKKGESGFDHTFNRAEFLNKKHTGERLALEKTYQNQWNTLGRAVEEKKNLFTIKSQGFHMKKKDDTKKESKINDSANSNTGSVGRGLASGGVTGGGVKNITLNISSLINQVQMIKENGKGVDTEQIRRILHEELTATIASAVMMGSGN
jgi:hypothetical protein